MDMMLGDKMLMESGDDNSLNQQSDQENKESGALQTEEESF
jgi:hypothetical protein